MFNAPRNLWDWKEVRFTFVADDGVSVLLNRNEIARVNLPEGPLTDRTWATKAPRTAAARAKPVVVTLPIWHLDDDETNNIGVEVHKNYGATPDMSFQMTVELIPNPDRVVVPSGDAGWWYRYDSAGASTWSPARCDLGNNHEKRGATPFGFGTPAVRTNLDVQPPSARPLTAYFCMARTMGDETAAFGDMEITTWANDGIVVYVDGKEVKRVNMPPGPVTSTTYATAAPWAALAARNPVTFTVPAGEFGKYGTFYIAVEVHLNWRGTTDMTFDMIVRSLGRK